MESFNPENVVWTKGSRGLAEAYYKIKVPSVTTIIGDMVPDPELEKWVNDVGEEKAKEIMNNAALRGTAMHTFIEIFMNALKETKDVSSALSTAQVKAPEELVKAEVPANKIKEGMSLFYKFYYSDYPAEYADLVGTELALYSKYSFYRGKADIFFRSRVFGPKVTDFKTSNGYISKGSVKEFKYKCQLGAYALALDEMLEEKNVKLNSASILCVSTQSESLQEIECSGKELERYKQEFKTLSMSWHKKNNQGYLFS
jgi:hypothetical protein